MARLNQKPTKMDGGYGWIIVASSFLAHMLQYGIVWSVGVFYVLFLENIDGEQGAVALISSLNTATFYVTGKYTFLFNRCCVKSDFSNQLL